MQHMVTGGANSVDAAESEFLSSLGVDPTALLSATSSGQILPLDDTGDEDMYDEEAEEDENEDDEDFPPPSAAVEQLVNPAKGFSSENERGLRSELHTPMVK